MAYRVRIVLDEHPILQDGKIMISGESTETIEEEYSDLASALAAISPAYVNDTIEVVSHEVV